MFSRTSITSIFTRTMIYMIYVFNFISLKLPSLVKFIVIYHNLGVGWL